ncbi:MAG: flagellar biosynthesis protein FlhA [Pseudomonadota bacterium]
MRHIFQPTVLMALALMAVILMMVLPMPSWVLDVGLSASFALAILIFTTTLFIERPLDFSAFPTILLASLMLRLSLNVSSTKLIIGEGHTGTDAAGHVIEGFANFVMSGSVALGLVVFGVLLIVNFMVITKGATRMAEVGARFALDGMPGKQLAIDSDMSAGAIDHEEAKRRRELELAETTFFGSLDGASKFVKGDAIAGLLITILNLVVGLSVGMLAHGMPIGEAAETYAILTVGDGLVSQIPAVIISIASGLLLARGGGSGAVDVEIVAQVSKHPAALLTVAFIMAVFAFVPGLPFLPFMAGALILAGAAALRVRAMRTAEAPTEEAPTEAPRRDIGDVLALDDIRVEFALDLVDLALDPSSGLDGRIAGLRDHIAESFGVILPEIRLTDDPGLPAGTYVIRVHGVEEARDRLERNHVLLLTGPGQENISSGMRVKEPVYGAPARWIPASDANDLVGETIVTPGEVLATHLMEVIKSSFPRLLGLRGLHKLLDAFTKVSDPTRAMANRRLLDDLVPTKIAPELLLQVLRLLLAERVSVRNLPVILESMAEMREAGLSPEDLSEHVRQRLADQITTAIRRPDGTLPLLQLAPAWEDAFERHQMQGAGGARDVALPPDSLQKLAQGLVEGVGRAAEQGTHVAIVTSARRRRFIRTIAATRGLTNPVLSYEEIGPRATPAIVGSVAA